MSTPATLDRIEATPMLTRRQIFDRVATHLFTQGRHVLHFYARGPNDPPGNRYVPCPACAAPPTPDRAPTTEGGEAPFQERVHAWIVACFGEAIGADKVERNHRFLEEALELVQAGGCTASEAHQLVDYVFSRPAGELGQEVGGVMNTLAALCTARGVDLDAEAERELARVWTKVEAIRAKQAAKPKHGPLPGPSTPADSAEVGLREAIEAAAVWREEQDKALSKQPPSSDHTWRRLGHQEQRDALRTALSRNPTS